MIAMKKNLFYVMALWMTVACTPATKQKQEEEPVQEDMALQGVGMEPEGVPFMKLPYRISVCGDRLVVLDLLADSCFYHVMEYPSLDYLYSIGKRGQGENEMTFPGPFQLCGNRLYISDGAKSIIWRYGLQKGTLERRFDVPVESSIDFVCKDDSTFYIEDMSGKSRFEEWSDAGGKVPHFTIPGMKEGEEHFHDAYLWRSYMAYHPSMRMLAMATQHGSVIELYDMKAHTCRLVAESKEDYPANMNESNGYYDIHWVGDELYALYNDEPRKERAKREEKTGVSIYGGSILRVFDREGNMKRQCRLDFLIDGFAVDKQRGKLIGITANSDQFIRIWDLPE